LDRVKLRDRWAVYREAVWVLWDGLVVWAIFMLCGKGVPDWRAFVVWLEIFCNQGLWCLTGGLVVPDWRAFGALLDVFCNQVLVFYMMDLVTKGIC
jgi:hypothetical protein